MARLRFRLAACAIACALAAPLAAQDTAQLARRVQSVETLIERSSAAKQIEDSRDPLAAEKRSKARALLRNAQAALQAGDAVATQRLLDEASKTMLEAVRQAAPEQVVAAKKLSDLNNRAESVRSLLAAQNRVAAEKGMTKSVEPTAKRVEALLADADRLAKAGDLDRARVSLDEGYLLAKVSIESLRRGDTLVKSLNFASKKEEYDYELDRNDTHRMLVTVLLTEKRAANPALDKMVQDNLDKAAKLRTEAERLAAQGGHEAAIGVLEDSTREIVRAIRAAGVFIPG